jgi:hypothetical protein
MIGVIILLPGRPLATLVLLVHPPELSRSFLAISNVGSRCFVDPNRTCIAELADQKTAFKVRYPVNVARIPVFIEPGCVVVGEFDGDGFEFAFLGVVHCSFHKLGVLVMPALLSD